MDPSLAKGHKNEFFREMGNDLQKAMDRHLARTIAMKRDLQKKRNIFQNYQVISESILGNYLFNQFIFGGKRNKKLFFYVYEDQPNRQYNSWKEKSIGTCVLTLHLKTFDSNVRFLGFNISEHAVQRIFERLIPDNIALTYKEKLGLFHAELMYAPLISAFWSLVAIYQLDSNRLGQLEGIIPSPNGLFLGTITPQKMNYFEIRTFVHSSQLNQLQRRLRDIMISMCEKYKETLLSLYFLKFEGVIKIDDRLINDFLNDGMPLMDAYNIEHDFLSQA